MALRFGRGLLVCALLGGQMLPLKGERADISLSGRIKVIDNRHESQSANAQNVVVWMSPQDPTAARRAFPGGRFRLAQHNKSFEPHILVVPVGAAVDFPNRDPFFHNVFSLFEGKRFDLGLYEAGTTRRVSFDRAGISYIFCNIHAEMSAVVIALDTPYYAISNRKGEIVIPDVPEGKYTMHVWYETALPENLTAMTRDVTVTQQTSTLGVLEVPAAAAVNAHKNKYGMDYEPPAPGSPGYAEP